MDAKQLELDWSWELDIEWQACRPQFCVIAYLSRFLDRGYEGWCHNKWGSVKHWYRSWMTEEKDMEAVARLMDILLNHKGDTTPTWPGYDTAVDEFVWVMGRIVDSQEWLDDCDDAIQYAPLLLEQHFENEFSHYGKRKVKDWPEFSLSKLQVSR